MKRKTGTILAALLVIAGGILLILHATNVIRISLFPGWWTLFIIIPTLISMLNTRINAGHLICLSVGIILLLRANGILTGINLGLLLLGLVVVCVGISLLWRRPAPGREASGKAEETYTAVFGGADGLNNSKDFHSAAVYAVFGGVDLDLREIGLLGDAYVDATAVFGGIEIYVPGNVHVEISGTPVFGGADDKTRHAVLNGPTLYIRYTAVFGGVTVSEEKK